MGKSLQIITEHHSLDFNLELLKRTISTYGLKVDFKNYDKRHPIFWSRSLVKISNLTSSPNSNTSMRFKIKSVKNHWVEKLKGKKL